MGNNEFHTVRGYQLLRQENNRLTPAMEDYLEMIRRNSDENGFMRVNQLAVLLNVKASSATKMVQKLGELGLLKYQRYGVLILTAKGAEAGDYLLRRHGIIEDFLKMIGTDNNLLAETELIEHNISARTLVNIEILNRFFRQYPDALRSYMKFRGLQ